MKHIIIILMLSAQVCQAQTYDEWVHQKKTQKKYLLQQIAALKLYSGYLQKGYTIASGGLKTIHAIKTGSYNLHNKFFESLGIVNPRIKQYKKVGDIIAMQIVIAKITAKTTQQCRNALSTEELNYLGTVFKKLLGDSADDLDRLMDVITNNKNEMTDEERIKAIEQIYDAMKDKQSFIQSFSYSAKGLIIQRMAEKKEVIISRKLNGLK